MSDARDIAWATHHGGGLDTAIARHGGRRGDWLDLSTGINPAPPALPHIRRAAWTRLPEAADMAATIAAARAAYGAPPDAGIVAAPGSQALISLLPSCLSPDDPANRRVAVVGPTYGEHAAAFVAAGYRVETIDRPQDASPAVRVLVVVNPNNPDGRRFPRADLEVLRRRLAERGGLLVVDEAFIDAEPAESMAPFAGRPGLLVHRSFGKVFGLAGLRLGFALATPALAAKLARRLGPWAVSGPALAVGRAWLGDPVIIAATHAALADQAERRDRTLADARLAFVGRTACFATVVHSRADRLFEALCRRHVLTRPFAHSPRWLRFGNPADEEEAERLRTALRESMREIAGETP